MNSVIIGFVMKLFMGLNEWYEYSLTYRITTRIIESFKNSFILGPIHRAFSIEQKRDYTTGSIVLGIPVRIFEWAMKTFKKIVLWIVENNKTSINYGLFSSVIAPISQAEVGISIFFAVLCGLFLIRTLVGFSLLNVGITLICFVLMMLDGKFIVNTVLGSFPSKIISWFVRR